MSGTLKCLIVYILEKDERSKFSMNRIFISNTKKIGLQKSPYIKAPYAPI